MLPADPFTEPPLGGRDRPGVDLNGAHPLVETPLMAFVAGVDLGTTFTAAAINRSGNVEMFRLSSSELSIPSIIYIGEDGSITTGVTARRRLLTEPDRVAHSFKRRMGDPAPLMIGGAPFPAHLLTGKLLDWVVDRIAEQEGGKPDLICITHPANWGPFRRELLDQAIKSAEVEHAVTLTEPEAAAMAYATTRPVAPGATVAVYDLGGGTFDAAVLRRNETGFDIVGTPDGVEALGGIDFDAALFDFVVEHVGEHLETLDLDEPSVMQAVQRLRDDCVEAKIALSSDTDTTIAVMLPGKETQIRITRDEFEQRITPLLTETITALRRTLRSAKVEAGDLDRVLLVGGSSRIPLVGQLVTRELGRPVAIDADPKNAIARGAAIYAQQQLSGPAAPPMFFPPPSAAATAAAAAAAAATTPPATQPTAAYTPPPTTGQTPVVTPIPPGRSPDGPAGTGPPGPSGPKPKKKRSFPVPLAIGGVVLILALIGGALAFAGGGDDDPETTTTSTTDPADDPRNIFAIEVGDCFEVTAKSEVEVVDCDDPHLGEAIFIFESSEGPDADYPGLDELSAEATPVCEDQLDTFIQEKVDAGEEASFVLDIIFPDEDEWVDQGSRRLVCRGRPGNGHPVVPGRRVLREDRGRGRRSGRPDHRRLRRPLLRLGVLRGREQHRQRDAARLPGDVRRDAADLRGAVHNRVRPRLQRVRLADRRGLPQPGGVGGRAAQLRLRHLPRTSMTSYFPGECFTDDPSIALMPCDEPHTGEIFFLITLAAADDDPFPGNDAIFAEGEPTCQAEFEGYVGTPVAESTLAPVVIAPSQVEFEDRQVRTAACAVITLDGSLIDQFSVKQSFL